MKQKLTRWFCFTIFISIFPILLDLLGLVLGKRVLCIENVLGFGQLFLVSCTLAAAGIGELMGLGFRTVAPMWAGWGCFISATSSAFAYAFVQNAGSDRKLVAYFSIVIFVPTVIAATACVIEAFRRGLRL